MSQPSNVQAESLNFARSLALVIGIDAYGYCIPRLTTAVNDATRLAEANR